MFNRESAPPDPDRTAQDDAARAAAQSTGLGVRYVSHPASLPNAQAPPPDATPPWSPSERFAAPGPAQVAMPLPDVTLPLAPSLPNLDADDGGPAPEPTVAWPAPVDAPQPARAHRARGSDDKLASLWIAEPVGLAASPAPARGKRLVVALCVVAGVSLCGGVAAMLTRRDMPAAPSIAATFNAPMIVLRASLGGQVTDVAVQPGQAVRPDTPLLTIRTTNADADFAVLAHVNGVVRSVETQTGAGVRPGAPLLRVSDCDHAFLTFGAGAALRAGQSVQVRLPNLPPAVAVVRASAGLTEPPDSLVAPLPAAALGGACPVGDVAAVSAAGGG